MTACVRVWKGTKFPKIPGTGKKYVQLPFRIIVVDPMAAHDCSLICIVGLHCDVRTILCVPYTCCWWRRVRAKPRNHDMYCVYWCRIPIWTVVTIHTVVNVMHRPNDSFDFKSFPRARVVET